MNKDRFGKPVKVAVVPVDNWIKEDNKSGKQDESKLESTESINSGDSSNTIQCNDNVT